MLSTDCDFLFSRFCGFSLFWLSYFQSFVGSVLSPASLVLFRLLVLFVPDSFAGFGQIAAGLSLVTGLLESAWFSFCLVIVSLVVCSMDKLFLVLWVC